jgi:hypothetical protein
MQVACQIWDYVKFWDSAVFGLFSVRSYMGGKTGLPEIEQVGQFLSNDMPRRELVS